MSARRSANCVSNGRDSGGQHLGVKAWGSQVITTGSLILRQKGTRFLAGQNVLMGRDHTLYAATNGRVTFGWNRGGKRKVSILPV